MPIGFAIAAAFLTRLPIGTPADAAGRLAASSWAFPLVGAGVGAIAALMFLVAELLGLGAGAAALLAVLASLCVTGALHEDGLADTADGLFAAMIARAGWRSCATAGLARMAFWRSC